MSSTHPHVRHKEDKKGGERGRRRMFRRRINLNYQNRGSIHSGRDPPDCNRHQQQGKGHEATTG